MSGMAEVIFRTSVLDPQDSLALAREFGFVPMVRDAGDLYENAISYIKAQQPKTKATALLGFNEPDLNKQADMTVAGALRLWPQLEKSGLRLGAPATINPDAEWLEQFMVGAERQGRRVDFMTAHLYGWPNSDDFLGKLVRMHEKYQRPIWVTEFAVDDFKARANGPANRYTGRRSRRSWAKPSGGCAPCRPWSGSPGSHGPPATSPWARQRFFTPTAH